MKCSHHEFFCGMQRVYLVRGVLSLKQGKLSQAEMAIKTLFGKERVPEVMNDLNAANHGSSELEARWLDLFGGRYWRGMPETMEILYVDLRKFDYYVW